MLWTTLVLPSTCFVVWTKELLNIETYMGVIDTPEVLAYHHSVPHGICVKEWYEWDPNLGHQERMIHALRYLYQAQKLVTVLQLPNVLTCKREKK